MTLRLIGFVILFVVLIAINSFLLCYFVGNSQTLLQQSKRLPFPKDNSSGFLGWYYYNGFCEEREPVFASENRFLFYR